MSTAIVGQRVRYIGPLRDRHGFAITYELGTVGQVDGDCVMVRIDDNDYSNAWAGAPYFFKDRWVLDTSPTLPPGFAVPERPFRTKDFEIADFTACGYTKAEAFTLYYSQRKRVVADPLAPMGDIIRCKAIGDAKGNALPYTSREQEWVADLMALAANPALRLLFKIEDDLNIPSEVTLARLIDTDEGKAALRAAKRRP